MSPCKPEVTDSLHGCMPACLGVALFDHSTDPGASAVGPVGRPPQLSIGEGHEGVEVSGKGNHFCWRT